MRVLDVLTQLPWGPGFPAGSVPCCGNTRPSLPLVEQSTVEDRVLLGKLQTRPLEACHRRVNYYKQVFPLNPTNSLEMAGLGWREPLPEARLPGAERTLFPHPPGPSHVCEAPRAPWAGRVLQRSFLCRRHPGCLLPGKLVRKGDQCPLGHSIFLFPLQRIPVPT